MRMKTWTLIEAILVILKANLHEDDFSDDSYVGRPMHTLYGYTNNNTNVNMISAISSLFKQNKNIYSIKYADLQTQNIYILFKKGKIKGSIGPVTMVT